MRAQIITIGDELLLGQTVDTNSAWLAAELARIGIRISSILSISDEGTAIASALDDIDDVSVVLMTGGLGPTKDDITKEVLCDYFGTRLVRNDEVLARIVQFFKDRDHPMLPVNEQQADLPESCTILANLEGTASGMWFEKDGVIFISMPGVPYEMRSMFTREVVPRLSEMGLEPLAQRILQITGIGESYLAEKIRDWENGVRADGMALAYLPAPGIVRLRLSVSPDRADELDPAIEELKAIVPRYVFGKEEDKLEEVLGSMLAEAGSTVSTAESCTGGYLAHLITSISGSSGYYIGSIVCYSNDVKVKELGVSTDDMASHGVVSQEVVEQMAAGACKKFGTTYSMATSGIAGPSGGTPDKPVGTVWIAVSNGIYHVSRKFQFGNDRERNIRKSALAAMNMLRLFIIDQG